MKNMEDTRSAVLYLMDKVKMVEQEIAEWKGILDTNGVSMNDPVVDHDGFPRNDIDVYQVRHARHSIICLQNDHKNLMRQIEQGLQQVHAEARTGESPMFTDDIPSTSVRLQPIAVVGNVVDGSPAGLSGLKTGDRVLEIGSVNSENMSSLSDIASAVEHSSGRSLSLTIERDGTNMRLSLTPKPWAGRGLLGCLILPIESVDR